MESEQYFIMTYSCLEQVAAIMSVIVDLVAGLSIGHLVPVVAPNQRMCGHYISFLKMSILVARVFVPTVILSVVSKIPMYVQNDIKTMKLDV